MYVKAPLHMHKICPKQIAHTKHENIKTRSEELYSHTYEHFLTRQKTLNSYISHTNEHTMTQLTL